MAAYRINQKVHAHRQGKPRQAPSKLLETQTRELHVSCSCLMEAPPPKKKHKKPLDSLTTIPKSVCENPQAPFFGVMFRRVGASFDQLPKKLVDWFGGLPFTRASNPQTTQPSVSLRAEDVATRLFVVCHTLLAALVTRPGVATCFVASRKSMSAALVSPGFS